MRGGGFLPRLLRGRSCTQSTDVLALLMRFCVQLLEREATERSSPKHCEKNKGWLGADRRLSTPLVCRQAVPGAVLGCHDGGALCFFQKQLWRHRHELLAALEDATHPSRTTPRPGTAGVVHLSADLNVDSVSPHGSFCISQVCKQDPLPTMRLHRRTWPGRKEDRRHEHLSLPRRVTLLILYCNFCFC